MNQEYKLTVGIRIREERKRLRFTSEAFAKGAGKSPESQKRYEGGINIPAANYLSGLISLGVDVGYIITGERSGKDRLTKKEFLFIESYRSSEDLIRKFILGGLGHQYLVALQTGKNFSDSSDINRITSGLGIPGRLLKERVRLGCTQLEFSNAANMSRARYAEYEKGSGFPSALALSGLATLGVNVTYIVCGFYDVTLDCEELALLSYYRNSPRAVMAAAEAALRCSS